MSLNWKNASAHARGSRSTHCVRRFRRSICRRAVVGKQTRCPLPLAGSALRSPDANLWRNLGWWGRDATFARGDKMRRSRNVRESFSHSPDLVCRGRVLPLHASSFACLPVPTALATVVRSCWHTRSCVVVVTCFDRNQSKCLSVSMRLWWNAPKSQSSVLRCALNLWVLVAAAAGTTYQKSRLNYALA